MERPHRDVATTDATTRETGRAAVERARRNRLRQCGLTC